MPEANPEAEAPAAVREARATLTRYYCEQGGHTPSSDYDSRTPVPVADEVQCDCGAVTWVRKK